MVWEIKRLQQSSPRLRLVELRRSGRGFVARKGLETMALLAHHLL